MDSTVKCENETLPDNKPCAKVPNSPPPSKIPISPTRRPVHLLSPNHQTTVNSQPQEENICNENNSSSDSGGKCTNSTTTTAPVSDDAQQQKQEENCKKINCRPGCCSSANCSSSSSIQHNSRLKGHQAANNLVNLRMSHSSDGHKSHRSLSPPGSNMTSSANSSTTTTASTSNSLNRISLQQLSSGKKAKRIKLYRNGDKFFKGIIYPLSIERIRSFDAFLEDLTRILVDQVSLPKGVRTIFTVDGTEKIKSLDQLKAGFSYVVSSTDHFIKLNYECISGVSKFETGIVPSASCISGPGGFAASISLSAHPANNNSNGKTDCEQTLITAYGATATVTIRNADSIFNPIVPVTCKILPCSIAPRSGSLPRNTKSSSSQSQVSKSIPSSKRTNNITSNTCQNNNNNNNNNNNTTKNHAIVSSASNKVKGNSINNTGHSQRINNASLVGNNRICESNGVNEKSNLLNGNIGHNSNDSNNRPVISVANSTCNTSDGRSSSSSCASASSYSNYASTNTSSSTGIVSSTGKDTGNGSSSSGTSSLASNVKGVTVSKGHISKVSSAVKGNTSHQSNALTSSLISKAQQSNALAPTGLSTSYTGPSSTKYIAPSSTVTSSRMSRMSGGNCTTTTSKATTTTTASESGIKQSASSTAVSNSASVRAQKVSKIAANSHQHLLLPTAKRGLPGKPVASRLNSRPVNKGVTKGPIVRAGRVLSPSTSASTSCVPNKLAATRDNESKVTSAPNKCRVVPSASTGRMVDSLATATHSGKSTADQRGPLASASAGKKRVSLSKPGPGPGPGKNSQGLTNNSGPRGAAAAVGFATAKVALVAPRCKNNTSASQSDAVSASSSILASSKASATAVTNNLCQLASGSSTSCSSTSGNSSESDDEDISSPIDSVTPPIETERIRRDRLPSDSCLSVLFPTEVILKYEIGILIGDGNFANVHECLDRTTKQHLALKIIDKIKCKGRESMIANEVAILKRINHPNIIQLVEQFDYSNELYLVTELVKGGDLFDAIAEANKYNEVDASGMMYDLASALAYLHSRNICHRDIKPENLLVCDYAPVGRNAKTLKLADFGLAVELPPGGQLFDVCGTPNYVAPEILSESGYDHKVDVWAAGVIAYVLLCGFPPFVSPENDQDELFDQILSGHFEFPSPSWNCISSSVKALISDMLNVNQDERPTASAVLRHPWIQRGSSFMYSRGASNCNDFNARHPSR